MSAAEQYRAAERALVAVLATLVVVRRGTRDGVLLSHLTAAKRRANRTCSAAFRQLRGAP